jgi:hypothetical protein
VIIFVSYSAIDKFFGWLFGEVNQPATVSLSKLANSFEVGNLTVDALSRLPNSHRISDTFLEDHSHQGQQIRYSTAAFFSVSRG